MSGANVSPAGRNRKEMSLSRRILTGGAVLAVAAILPVLLGQVSKPSSRDWPTQNYDLAGTRYSPLRQIDTTNVSKLKQVWTYRLRSDERSPFTASEAVPIVVNGVMYLPAGNRVVALEPETGKELWRYVPKDGTPSRRGVTDWP